MILAVTPGDPDGIGPEIVWKILQSKKLKHSSIRLLCVGAARPFLELSAPVVEITPAQLKQPLIYPTHLKKPFVWLLPAPTIAPKNASACLPGFQAGWAIQAATSLVLQQSASALVTGPISKHRLQLGGFNYPGHTEFLADLCAVKKRGRRRTPPVTMLLANQFLKVSLVTIHIALKDVPQALTAQAIEQTVMQTYTGLQSLWNIDHPRLAICALNPHAGENGQFGTEEYTVLEPIVSRLRKKLAGKCSLEGPMPADTLFARHQLAQPQGLYDAVICLFHDQGLIPVKLLDFYHTVNITLGLPIIRTSVDHGVGFDIAGQGIANPSSLNAAIQLAATFVRNKKEPQ